MRTTTLTALRRFALLILAFLSAGTAHAALNLGIEVNPDPVRPGERLRVELTVTNDGVAAVNNVALQATVPVGVNNFFEYLVSGGGTCDVGSWNYICEVGENVVWNQRVGERDLRTRGK